MVSAATIYCELKSISWSTFPWKPEMLSRHHRSELKKIELKIEATNAAFFIFIFLLHGLALLLG
jgi:hypothetical protein